MKNLLITFMAIAATLVLSGCGAKNIAYDKYSIERNLNKDIDKISEQNINIIDSSDEIIVKKLGNKSYSLRSYELEASNMNKEISKEFFSQYFNKINSDKNAVFTVNSKIKDFVIRNTLNSNSSNAEVEIEFKVYKNNNLILSKIYRKESVGITIIELRLTTEETTFRKLEKTVLSIYENEFKKDLLEALRKNS